MGPVVFSIILFFSEFVVLKNLQQIIMYNITNKVNEQKNADWPQFKLKTMISIAKTPTNKNQKNETVPFLSKYGPILGLQ